MSTRIKVIIVDDHPLFRQGLRQVIEADSRFHLVGEAGDGESGLRLIQEKKPAIAVLDVSLPKLSGLEVTRQIKSRKLPTSIIILTMYKEEETFNQALDLGVKGFVLKENAVEDIVNSLAKVAEGEHYLSPSISSYLVRRRSRADELAAHKPGLEDLTKAERRILKLIGEKKDQPGNRRRTLHQPPNRGGAPRQYLRQARTPGQPQSAAIRARKPFDSLSFTPRTGIWTGSNQYVVPRTKIATCAYQKIGVPNNYTSSAAHACSRVPASRT